MTRTPIGRAFFAVGGNPHAAVYTGIDVGRTRFLAYCLSGALAGLAGYLWVSRYAVAYVDIAWRRITGLFRLSARLRKCCSLCSAVSPGYYPGNCSQH